MKERNLVIGANSFIGSHLVSYLKIENEVVGIYHKNTNLLFDDVNNLSMHSIDKIENKFDNVYILSSFINVGKLNTDTRFAMYKTNIDLVDKICSKFEKSKIIFCSSIMVYDYQKEIINEKTCTLGLNEYGLSKIWGERIVKQTSKYAIVRPCFIYGKEMKLTPMIPSMIEQGINNKVITVFGQGIRQQNYLHVSDLVIFLRKAALCKKNDIFLATNDKSVSNLEIAKLIAKKTKSKVVLNGEDNTPSFYFDNAYTVNALDYKAQMPLEKGINELIKWIKGKKF